MAITFSQGEALTLNVAFKEGGLAVDLTGATNFQVAFSILNTNSVFGTSTYPIKSNGSVFDVVDAGGSDLANGIFVCELTKDQTAEVTPGTSNIEVAYELGGKKHKALLEGGAIVEPTSIEPGSGSTLDAASAHTHTNKAILDLVSQETLDFESTWTEVTSDGATTSVSVESASHFFYDADAEGTTEITFADLPAHPQTKYLQLLIRGSATPARKPTIVGVADFDFPDADTKAALLTLLPFNGTVNVFSALIVDPVTWPA